MGGFILLVIGLSTFGELQWIHLVLASPFVGVSLLSLYFDWRPVLVVRLVGVFLLLAAAINGYRYLTVERYAVEPGLIVFSLGGLLLVIVGLQQQVPRLGLYSADE